MEEPEQGNSAQNRRNLEAYQSWRKKDRCARFTMLSNMHNDLIGEFESYGTAQDMWIALKAKFGGTMVTRLRALTLKFDTFRMQRAFKRSRTCRIILSLRQSTMWCKDKVLPSLLDMANARHLRPSTKVMKKHPKEVRMEENPQREPIPPSAQEGKRGGWKQAEQACFNCGVVGHFARDCTKPKKVLFDPFSRTVCYVASSQVLIAYSILDWIVDTGATDHVARDRVGFVEYRRVPAGSRWMHMGNESRVEVLGIGTYKLQLRHGRTLLLHNVLYAPGMRQNLLSVNVLLELGFSFGFHGHSVDIFLGSTCFGHAFISDDHLFHLDIDCSAYDSSFALLTQNDYDEMNWHARTDHRREYLSEQFRELCENKGIHRQLTIPGTSQQNGVAERRNRTLLDMHLDGGVTEIVSRDVEFMENDFPSRGDVGQSLELYEMVESWDDTPATNPRDSGREITHRESFISVAQDDTEPRSYDEAMSSPACNEWMIAMKDEMESMRTNQVWELVDLPSRRKSIGNKWVLKIKRKADDSIDKYKARLVAKGYTQREGVDYKETFSPVVRFASIHLILAMVASLDLEFYQMDVKTAFLNGELDEEIFMDQPIGFVVKGQERKEVIYNGFLMIEEDQCVYVKRSEGSFIILSLYVYEILLDGNNKEFIKTIKEWLSSTFEMKDMGEASFVLGVKILRDRSRKLLGLSQETYIRKVLKRFHMQDCKPIDTPVGKGDSLSSEMCPKTQAKIESMARVPYANAIGSLMYVMLCTHPDICFAVGLVSRFQSNPGPAHWKAVKRILRAMDPVTIYSNSMAALAYAKDSKYHGKTKHIEIKYHYIRDMPGEAGCEFSQTLKENGLMKNSSQVLGATGLRSVRWKYQDAFMTYASLRMEEKSTATCDHTTCARNDHQIGR
uniref:CCHC-type domain-containing protein n=1 Tax=Fagus sylvatica TaxID=28930 RepID=A0A2N9H4Y7_FAGSY